MSRRGGTRCCLVRTRLAFWLVLALAGLPPGSSFSLSLEYAGAIEPSGIRSGLLSPSGLWCDPLRNLILVADTQNNRIVVLNPQGSVLKSVGRDGELNLPQAIAASQRGTLYVAERSSSELKVLPEYSSLGREEFERMDLSTHGGDRPVQPVAMFVDAQDFLYVADSGNRQVLVFDGRREHVRTISKLGQISDVWVRGDGVFFADSGFGGVRIHDRKGRWQRTVGEVSSRFPTALQPRAVAVDRRERLWVLEESGTIRALDRRGNPVYTRPSGDLLGPIDLALDEQGNLYVLEQGGGKVSVFQIQEF